MTRKTPDKTRARELQALTGWSYSRCLALVREHATLDVTTIVQVVQAPPSTG